MPTIFDDTATYRTTSPAERLRITMAAVRVAFTWFGVRKSLSPIQKAEAAATFNAEHGYFSAGKKLLDTSHPAFKAVTTIRGRMISFWRGTARATDHQGKQHAFERLRSLMVFSSAGKLNQKSNPKRLASAKGKPNTVRRHNRELIH